jgi:hypothetical protein
MHERKWVAAAPFRAHLNHICGSTGLSWPIVALEAGMPLGLVRDLLDVRPGRRVQRIAPDLAFQILSITPQSILEVRSRAVPARSTRQALRRLVADGWTCATLASRLHTSWSELDALAAGLLAEVPALLDLQLTELLAIAEPAPAGPSRRSADVAA